MRAMDLYEDGFPHGTREGYQQGCHGNACPKAVEGGLTCMQANTRYAGDYAYRKAVDAGATPAQIAEMDAAAAPAMKNRTGPPQPADERPAEPMPEVDVAPAPVRPSPPTSVPQFETFEKPAPPAVPNAYSDDEVKLMVKLHGEGLNDSAIARKLGRSQPQVSKRLRGMGLAPNGKRIGVNAPPIEPTEPAEAIVEREREARVDEVLAELTEAHGAVERLQGELDTALADVAIANAARETLSQQVDGLRTDLVVANTDRETAERRVGELTDRVATLNLELDVAKSPDAVPSGAGLAIVPPAPVATAEEALQPARAGAVGLDIQQLGDALSVRLHGGEPVHLNLQFENGALSDVGVKIGA